MKKEITADMLKEYRIENENLSVTLLNYGGRITGIYCKNGTDENLVLSFDNLFDYVLDDSLYMNAVVGPTSGRMANGRYTYKGKTYQLSQNDGNNHLHGGISGVSNKLFKVEEISENKLKLSLETDHNEDGYVGLFRYELMYTLQEHKLNVSFSCYPEKETPLSMTQHLYFNLSGDMERAIGDEFLYIPTKKYLELDVDSCPCKEETIKCNDIFNYTSFKRLKEDRESNENLLTVLNTPYIFKEEKKVILEDRESNRRLVVETDAPCVVIYNAYYFQKTSCMNKGKEGYSGCALAIETQDIPNGINIYEDKERYIYSSNRPYVQYTSYHFMSIPK